MRTNGGYYKLMKYKQSREILHSGVKGMKWGVHKAKGYVSNKINLFKSDRSVRRDNRNAYKNRKNLSDSELRARTQRLRMENDYKREIDNSKRNGISKEVWKAIRPVVTAAAIAGATAYVGHRIDNRVASHKFKTNGKLSPSQAKDVWNFVVKAGRNKAEGKKH